MGRSLGDSCYINTEPLGLPIGFPLVPFLKGIYLHNVRFHMQSIPTSKYPHWNLNWSNGFPHQINNGIGIAYIIIV